MKGSRPQTSLNQNLPRFSAPSTQINGINATQPQVSLSRLGQNYSNMLSAIADVGEGVSNAAMTMLVRSGQAEKQERDRYLANIETSDIVETNRIFNENSLDGNDPEKLTVLLEQYKNGKRQEMPESIREFYDLQFDRRAAVLKIQSQNEFYNKIDRDAQISLKTSRQIVADEILAKAGPQTEIELEEYSAQMEKFNKILDSEVSHGYLTQEEAMLERQNFAKDNVVETYKKQMTNMPVEERGKLLLQLQTGEGLPENLTIKDREQIVGALNGYDNELNLIYQKGNAEAIAAKELEDARYVSNLEIKAFKGQIGESAIIRAEQQGKITPEKKAQLIKMVYDQYQARTQEAGDLAKIARVLKGEDYIDPKDAKDDKTVQLGFERIVMPAMAQAKTSEEKKTILADYVKKVGVVPSGVKSLIRGVFRGANVDDKVYYADLVARIQEETPNAISDFDDKDVLQAVMINGLVKAGTPNLEAVKKVQEMSKDMTPQKIEGLKEELRTLRKDDGDWSKDKTSSHIEKMFAPWYALSPDLPKMGVGVDRKAREEYNALFDTFYMYTNGDVELAKQQADRKFKNRWGVSEINGSKQVAKLPIEAKYPNIPPADLRNQFLKDIKSLPDYRDLPDENFFLNADAITERQWNSSEPPSYRVIVKNKDGVFEPVPDPKIERWTAGTFKDLTKNIAIQKRLKKLEGEK